MTTSRKNDGSRAAETSIDRPASMSRRKLLKQGSAAMPAILTLQSGSALAQSSVYVGDSGDGTPPHIGNIICLDTTNAEPLPNGRTYKFVNTFTDVNMLPDGEYYPEDNRSSTPTDAYSFCRSGGKMWLKDGGFHPVEIPKDGIIMSASAVSSLAHGLDVKINYHPLS